MSNFVLVILWLITIFGFWDGIRKWGKDERLEAVMRIMEGVSAGYLSIFLPIMIYLWPLEKYGDPPFFKLSFILFIVNSLALSVLAVLSLLNYIEGNTNTEKWNGD